MNDLQESQSEKLSGQEQEMVPGATMGLHLTTENQVHTVANHLISFLDATTQRYSLSTHDIQLLSSLLPHMEQLQDENLWGSLAKILRNKSLLEADQVNMGGLEELYHRRLFRYRPHYNHLPQHSAYTCGAACYLMATNIHTGDLRPSKRDEIDLFHELADPKTHLISTTALIGDAVGRGLYVRIHSEHDYDNITFEAEWAETLRQAYVEQLGQLAPTGLIENNTGVTIDEDYIRDALRDGETLLMNGTTPFGIPHMRLIGGYHGESFIISDPLETRSLPQSPAVVETMIEAPLGKFGFSVSVKPFDFYQIPSENA